MTLSRTLLRGLRELVPGGGKYRPGRGLSSRRLGQWCVYSDPFANLSAIEEGCYASPPYDERGIVRLELEGQAVENPGTVALVALNAWHATALRSGEAKWAQLFYRHVDWLRDRLDVGGDSAGRWFYRFKPPGRNVSLPWVSCFAQGLGASVLLRAAQDREGESYLAAALRAARLLDVPVSDGGVRCEDDGLTFLEEYPEEPPSHVLNGFISAVLALLEMEKVLGESTGNWIAPLRGRCVETVSNVLPRYMTPRGMRYDLAGEELVGADYYHFVVAQLRALSRMTGRREFARTAGKCKRRFYWFGIKKILHP